MSKSKLFDKRPSQPTKDITNKYTMTASEPFWLRKRNPRPEKRPFHKPFSIQEKEQMINRYYEQTSVVVENYFKFNRRLVKALLRNNGVIRSLVILLEAENLSNFKKLYILKLLVQTFSSSFILFSNFAFVYRRVGASGHNFVKKILHSRPMRAYYTLFGKNLLKYKKIRRLPPKDWAKVRERRKRRKNRWKSVKANFFYNSLMFGQEFKYGERRFFRRFQRKLFRRKKRGVMLFHLRKLFRRKKKSRLNFFYTSGPTYNVTLSETRNNMFASVNSSEGKVVIVMSNGSAGFRNTQRDTPFSYESMGLRFRQFLDKKNIIKIYLRIKMLNNHRIHTFLNGFLQSFNHAGKVGQKKEAKFRLLTSGRIYKKAFKVGRNLKPLFTELHKFTPINFVGLKFCPCVSHNGIRKKKIPRVLRFPFKVEEYSLMARIVVCGTADVGSIPTTHL
jgi:ribosomal protein S11